MADGLPTAAAEAIGSASRNLVCRIDVLQNMPAHFHLLQRQLCVESTFSNILDTSIYPPDAPPSPSRPPAVSSEHRTRSGSGPTSIF